MATKIKKNQINIDTIYPVGSIYLTTVSTNPSTYFGGTWEAWGTGRVPVGVDTGQTEFDTVEETGGEKVHQLIAAEMPSHTHKISVGSSADWNDYLAGSSATFGIEPTYNVSAAIKYSINETVGGDGTHNNLQPYITCYMWKRTD